MFRSLEFFTGQTVSVASLQADLAAFGYERGRSVSEAGTWAVRGGIVDIFPVNYEAPVRLDIDGDRIASIRAFDPLAGGVTGEHQAVIILPAKGAARQPFTSAMPLSPFVDLEQGDYVVHHRHGIGRYLGVRSFGAGQEAGDHFIIEYKGGDRLFVPRRDIHLVQKYVSFTKKPPRLFRLGSREWERVRRMVEKRIQRLAAELLHLQAARAAMRGHAFAADTPWQKDFEEAFPFEETPDQARACAAVRQDMEDPRPMDRLLCGDVGYGKTEVALRAAFKAVMGGKQVAVLVPTTVLAEQHFVNFSRRMRPFPVRVGMLSRFRTPGQQKALVRDTAQGAVDILIGTHRLLSRDMAFRDLGLIIIDEEQRFGVQAKERLKHMKLLCDVLTLTATPIPRTLYMAMAGARDMSVIATPPLGRIPVETRLVRFDEEVIGEALRRELARRGQAFFLHNRIDDIMAVAEKVGRLVPGARIAVGHGQMAGKDLEQVMLRFLEGEIDVLVCTTIIESGIDIPNANTLIVNRAERFGLADLHQLRGRVGRTNVPATALFIVPARGEVSGIARRRLEALEKFTDLGAGFHIAYEDLQIRGAGNILGEEQHGYIASVGFDLYCRMLKESVENIKREAERAHGNI